MFHSRTLNNQINRLHERCLRIICSDNTSSFTDLLEIDNSVSVYHRNILVLATELYKFVNGLSPKLVSDCFKLTNMTVYNTRNRSTFYSRLVRTTLHWHRITLPLGTLPQWKPHACMSALSNLHPSGWFRLTFEYKINFSSWFSCFTYI